MPWKSFFECLLLENLPGFSAGQLSLRLFILQKACYKHWGTVNSRVSP